MAVIEVAFTDRFWPSVEAIETGEPYQTILNPPPADPSCAHPESTRPEWANAGGLS